MHIKWRGKLKMQMGLGISVALFLGSVLTACDGTDDGSSGDTVKLRIAWMGPEREAFRAWKKGFEEERPDVEIEQQFIPYDQGPTVYNTMIQGENLPDLGYLFMGMISEYAERGVLEPLDGYMTDAERDEWIAAALSAGKYRGKTYGVPLWGANRVLYVRRDWMDEEGMTGQPDTWEAVRELAIKLNKPPDRYGICVGAGRPKHLMQEQIAMMWGFGADFFGRDGKLAINSPEAVAYVKFLTDMHLVDRVMPPGILNLNADDCYAVMDAGKAGLTFSGPWQYKRCQDAGIACEPLTMPAGRDRKMLLILDIFSVFSTSKQKDLAYEFIRFTQRPENRVLMDVENGGVPVTGTVSEHAYYRTVPIRNYLAQVDLIKLTPQHPEWTKIQDGWGEAIQMVLAGTASPREALDTVYARLMRELEDPTLPRGE